MAGTQLRTVARVARHGVAVDPGEHGAVQMPFLRPVVASAALPTPWRSRLLVVAAALATAPVLAGCGSSGAGAAQGNAVGSTPPAAPTGTASASGSPSGSPSAVVSSATAPADPGRCRSPELSVAPGAGQGAAGHLYLVVTLTNISSRTCHLEGYPGMRLLDADKKALPTTVVRGGGMLPSTAPGQVQLAAGAVASFTMTYSDVPGAGPAASCPQAAYAEVTPPDDTEPLLLTSRMAPCGGEIDVTPVVSGANGVTP